MISYFLAIPVTLLSESPAMAIERLVLYAPKKSESLLAPEIEKSDEMRSLSSPEIGYIIHHFPLNNLLQIITKDKINGKE